MNTKETEETINFLLGLKSLYMNSGQPNYARIITDCINSIEENKENGRHKEMWEDFKKEYGKFCFSKVSDKPKLAVWVMMDGFEQKYFPESKIRKSVEVEVLAENEDRADYFEKQWRKLYLRNASLKKQLLRVLARVNLIIPDPLIPMEIEREEIADYCLKKYAEIYLEVVELENKLEELSKGNCNG